MIALCILWAVMLAHWLAGGVEISYQYPLLCALEGALCGFVARKVS